MPESRDDERLRLVFADLPGELLAARSTASTLGSTVAAAVRIVPGATAAGVSVLHDGRVETLAATSHTVVAIDEAQSRLGEGPYFEVSHHGGVQRVDDLAGDARWPAFARETSHLGVASLVSFEMFVGEHPVGALSLLADRPFAFTARAEVAVRAFAPYAAVAIAASRQARQLEAALRTRMLIGEAMGIVMERYHLTSEEAFERLRRLSQRRHLKLHDLAEEITYSGEV